MKNFHTHFKLLLLFGVFAVFLFNCKKDEPYDPSKEMDDYFEGKVNGVEFETNGGVSCLPLSGNYYPDGYLSFDGGFWVLSADNCDTGERIIIGTRSNLHEGVFTSCDTSDSVGPRGEYARIYTNGQSTLHAKECIDIRLEILRLVERSATDGYIEGTLEATARDPELDTTIVISDVKFGYNY